jgi:hypothetical protein
LLRLDQSQVRLYSAITRYTALVMAALAICAVTTALLRHRTGTQAPPPLRPDQPPPPDPGMVPLTVPQVVKHLLAAMLTRPAAQPRRPLAGSTGNAATKPAPAGTTSAHDSPAIPQLP